MSISNAMANVQASKECALRESTSSELTSPKFTAAQIEKDCPARLHDLAQEITEGLEKVYEQKKLADDQVIAVKKLIAEVKALCDVGGFAAFREKFFPNLGKSRVYELLAIGTGKKSVEEARASNRKHQAKHRANKAEVPLSVTVTDELDPAAKGIPQERSEVDAPAVASDQIPEKKPRSSVSPGDEVTPKFTTLVLELDRRTYKRPPAQFSATAASVEVLTRLGSFLTDTANFKKSEAVKPARITALPDNGGVSAAEQSAEEIKTERPAPAEDLRP